MSDNLYWEPEFQDYDLNKWVSSEVACAMKYYWETEPPNAWVEDGSKGLAIVFCGPPKPTERDPSGSSDVYSVDFDILPLVKRFIDPYDGDAHGPAQIDDVRQRSSAARAFAKQVMEFADKFS